MPQSNSYIPFVPDNAPFSADQRAWLNGFLAGMFSERPGEAVEETPAVKATILFGSQTGNAEALAGQAAKQLKSSGVEATVVDMDAYSTDKITEEENLVLVSSTYGDGEPPDNAAGLHSFLMDEGAPRLEKTSFAVFGLGDTSYPEFCKCAKDFDGRLETLGAKRLVDRVDADVEFEEPFEGWIQSLGSALASSAPTETVVAPEVSAETEVAEAYGKKNPFPAKVLQNLNLNKEGSAKETRHVSLSLEGSGLEYEVGDALAVIPLNNEKLVNDLIARLELDPKGEVMGADGASKSLEEALRSDFEITNVTKKLAEAVAASNGSESLLTLIENKKAFDEYCWGRDLLDLVTDYPVQFANGEALVSILKKLNHRLYSISSSPEAHPSEVHVTVARVFYEKEGRTRFGVCSDFLSLAPEGSEVMVYTHANKNFRPPEDLSQDAIMIGPGTGIAPFRAFMEDRIAKEASGRNWLFFGDQKCATDFLYRDTLEQWFKDGKLQRLDTAFSRDQKEKIYVQDRMREQGAELFAWLEGGASFFVCGDASRMAKDVDLALHEIIAEHGKMSEDEASGYVKKLKSEKHYQRDVY
ncbi:MAG: flavodoxin domain-containing protein [Verrucomicrobiota bacterium]